MKKIILILLFVFSISFAQVIKKIDTQEISGSGMVTLAEIVGIQADIYLVNLGNMVKNEDGEIVFESIFNGSYILKSEAKFELTQKEIVEINGVENEN